VKLQRSPASPFNQINGLAEGHTGNKDEQLNGSLVGMLAQNFHANATIRHRQNLISAL
jgi:hypothetical protein